MCSEITNAAGITLMLDVQSLTGKSISGHFDPGSDAPLLPDCTIKQVRGLISIGGQHSGAIYDDTETHRFVLWRVWSDDTLPLVCIGLNPSTATELASDNTVTRDLGFARDWGFGGLVKLNLHSYRSTDPKALYDWVREHGEANTDPLTGGVTNDDYLKWFTDPKRAGLVLAAWGNHGKLLFRGARVADMLYKSGVKLFALKVTKLDQPQHTLYTRADLLPKPYSRYAA